MVAPFWADIDLRLPYGAVYYLNMDENSMQGITCGIYAYYQNVQQYKQYI